MITVLEQIEYVTFEKHKKFLEDLSEDAKNLIQDKITQTKDSEENGILIEYIFKIL